jgi:hypothetical protein
MLLLQKKIEAATVSGLVRYKAVTSEVKNIWVLEQRLL